MANNAQVTPLGLSANRFTRARAKDQIWKHSLSLPCEVTAINGGIVTVAFQVTAAPGQQAVTIPPATMPIAESEYTRLPIQVGCKGVALSADAYLGGVSGLGGGTATLGQTGNLTGLVFMPCGNTGWFSVNGDILTMYGPGGVILMDEAQTTFVNLTPGEVQLNVGTSFVNVTSSQIQLIAGGTTLTVDSLGINMNGKEFATHEHVGVQTGISNTGTVA